MKLTPEDKMKFCCAEIGEYIDHPDYPVKYENMFREFCIDLPPFNTLGIEYCPWCGSKLPKDLREEWFDILEQEYGIETEIGEVRSRTDIPKEFRSDEWWKKRGL